MISSSHMGGQPNSSHALVISSALPSLSRDLENLCIGLDGFKTMHTPAPGRTLLRSSELTTRDQGDLSVLPSKAGVGRMGLSIFPHKPLPHFSHIHSETKEEQQWKN